MTGGYNPKFCKKTSIYLYKCFDKSQARSKSPIIWVFPARAGPAFSNRKAYNCYRIGISLSGSWKR